MMKHLTMTTLQRMMMTMPTYQLPDTFTAIVKSSVQERLEILRSLSMEDRFRKALPLLERQIQSIKDARQQLRKRSRSGAGDQEGNNPQLIIPMPKRSFGGLFKGSRRPGNDDDDEDDLAVLERKIRCQ